VAERDPADTDFDDYEEKLRREARIARIGRWVSVALVGLILVTAAIIRLVGQSASRSPSREELSRQADEAMDDFMKQMEQPAGEQRARLDGGRDR